MRPYCSNKLVAPQMHVDATMLAVGHASVQMHERYVNLKGDDVAEAFGLEMVDRKSRSRKPAALSSSFHYRRGG